VVNTLPCQGRDRGFEPRHFRRFTGSGVILDTGACFCVCGFRTALPIQREEARPFGVRAPCLDHRVTKDHPGEKEPPEALTLRRSYLSPRARRTRQ